MKGDSLRIRVSDGVIDKFGGGTRCLQEERLPGWHLPVSGGMQIDAGSRRRYYFGRKKENGSTGTTEPGREFFRSGRADRTAEAEDISLGGSFYGVQQGMKLLKQCSEQIDRVEKQVMKLNEEGGLEPLDPQ